MRQAKRLMDKHGLTAIDSDVFSMGSASATSKNTRHPKWEIDLAITVATAFGCTSFSGLRKFTFVGPEGSAEVAAYTFDVLLRQLDHKKRELLKLYPELKASTKKKLGQGFAEGWVYSVYDKVMAFANPVSSKDSSAHSDYLKTAHGASVGKARNSKSAINKEDAASVFGARVGISEGEKVNLFHGVRAGDQPARIAG